ncbi:MAG: DUF4190 domain-containing protein [Mycobacterium sp.]|nr:MAG: DUF4190 domain-containing protein [Mycobacterium sp.]
MTTIAPQLVAPAPAVKVPTVKRAAVTRISGLAVMSLVLGVLQYVFLFIPCWLVTIPFGVHALHQADKANAPSRAVAIAGLALSVIHFAVYTFVFIWLLTSS